MISEKIKHIIKRKNTTSKEIATKLGMTNVYFSKMINGNPTLSSLQSIANILDCSVADFFDKETSFQLIDKEKLHTFHSKEELKKFVNNL